MGNRAYLSLGSNIEAEKNLPAAVRLLATMGRLVAVSSVWETAPVGLSNQPDFLNAAALVETDLPAPEFKQKVLRHIEQTLGRVRRADKFGPRSIDIDIMLFNQQILDLDRRHIPDAEVLERAFVAIPLAEIAPDYCHPETGQTLSEIAQQFSLTNETMSLHLDVSRAVAQFIRDDDQNNLNSKKVTGT
jgi:2-amino-4-hydroxy-6-hydroxymethyldihydropteridine diphosphokinase